MSQSDKNSIIHKMAEELADNLSLSADHQTKLNQTEQASLEQLQIISQVAQLHRQYQTGHSQSAHQESDQKSNDESLFTWGRLSVKAAIGQGAFGEVYRAHDQILDRDVALKLLKDDVQGPLKSQAFIEEAKRMAKVRHPNVLAIHGANIHEGRAGFWADFINGHTLDEAPDFGRMNYDSLFQFARQVASGLQAIHQSGLIHGDIKPGNIIQDQQGHFIIMDFGAGLTVTESQQLSGYLHGTPALMAPELFNNKHSGSATDIYAFGATLYKLASDRYPVTGKDLSEIQHNHQIKAYRSLKKRRPDLPRDFTALVQAMVAHDPKDRPNCEKILRSLYDIETAPQRRRNKITLWSIIALLLVGTGVSSWGFFQANKARNQAVLAQNKADTINEFLRNMLSAGSNLGGGRDVRVVDVLDKAANSLSSEPNTKPDVAIEIHQSLADSYNAIYEPDKALEHADISLTLATELYPPHSLQVTRGRLEKVQALQLLNRFQASNDLAHQIVADAAETLGDNHWFIQGARKNIINNLYSQNKYDEAISLLDQYFSEVPEPATATNNLGFEILHARSNALYVKGQYAKAIESAQKSIAWLAAYPNESLLNQASAKTILGLSQLEEGLIDAGAKNLADVLSLREQVHGTETESYLDALINLGAAQRLQNKPQLALKTTSQAFELSKKLYQGQSNKQTIGIGINLANMHVDLGDAEKGERIMRESLDLAYQALGDHAPEALILEYNLAELLNKQGHYKEAEEWAVSTTKKKEQTFGPDHVYTFLSRDNQAISFAGQQRFNQANNLHQNVVAGMTEKMGAKHPYTLLVRQHQIDSLIAAGALQEVRVKLSQLVTDLTTVHGTDHPDVHQYQSILNDLQR